MNKKLLAVALVLLAATPAAAEQGDWLVRLRGVIVAPNDDSSAVMPTFPTGSVSVDEAIVPELDFTYFLTNNIGAELILATSKHDISGEGALAGLGEIADTWVLPPTLTLQYHFLPNERVRPYIGAGVNYTIFYSEDARTALVDAIGPTTVDLDDSVGFAVQAGVDIDITERFFFNADIKYVDMDTTATLNTGGLINTVDVDINPIIAGVGFGMRF
jgi:outer membrane protein